MTISVWSETPSANATADSANGVIWSEGMAPSQVNDSARAMMAEIKKSFASSLLQNGHQFVGNGLIIKWGYNAGGADSFQTFPTAFPSACRFVITQPTTASLVSTSLVANAVESVSAAGFTYRLRIANNGGAVGQSALPFFWVAFGA